MKKLTILSFIFLLATVFIGCGNESSPSKKTSEQNQEKCKYGTPTPIFSDALSKVTDHSFSAEGQKGIEEVSFENGVELELLQSGCNEILQSYQFKINQKDSSEELFWIDLAAKQFQYLSTLSDNHVSFGFWANAISKNIDLIKIGTPFEPEPNTFIKIDKIPSGEQTILIVIFEGKG